MNEPKTEQPVAWAREAAAKWRRKQNPDIARRINDREEDAYALGFKAGAAAADWENATHERGNAFAAAPCYAPLRWSALPTRAGWWWLVIDDLATEPEIVLVQQIYTHGMTFFRTCSPRERDVTLYPGRRWAGPIELPAMPDVEPEHNDKLCDPRPEGHHAR